MINNNMGQYTLAHAIRKQILYVLCISTFLFYNWFALLKFIGDFQLFLATFTALQHGFLSFGEILVC